jgi:uncharacterized protein (TIGR03435 family)
MARRLGEMVVDKTGIEGVYDFELTWTDDLAQATAPSRCKPKKCP